MSLEDYLVLILRRMKSVGSEDEGLNNPSLRHSNIIPKHPRLNGAIPIYLCFAFRWVKRVDYLSKGNVIHH